MNFNTYAFALICILSTSMYARDYNPCAHGMGCLMDTTQNIVIGVGHTQIHDCECALQYIPARSRGTDHIEMACAKDNCFFQEFFIRGVKPGTSTLVFNSFAKNSHNPLGTHTITVTVVDEEGWAEYLQEISKYPWCPLREDDLSRDKEIEYLSVGQATNFTFYIARSDVDENNNCPHWEIDWQHTDLEVIDVSYTKNMQVPGTQWHVNAHAKKIGETKLVVNYVKRSESSEDREIVKTIEYRIIVR